jgi:hypothetical protein
MDDLFSKFAGGCDCASKCFEEKRACGAFWTVFGGSVCDCASARELFAVIDKGGDLGEH